MCEKNKLKERGDHDLKTESDHVLNLIQEGQDFIKKNTPEVFDNFQSFLQSVRKEDVLSPKFKELIALAIAVRIRCQPCIISHVKNAVAQGATVAEIMEACNVAIMMGGGPAVAYTSYVIQALKDFGII